MTKSTRATRSAAIGSIRSGDTDRVYLLEDTARYGCCTVSYSKTNRGIERTVFGPDGQVFATKLVSPNWCHS